MIKILCTYKKKKGEIESGLQIIRHTIKINDKAGGRKMNKTL